MASPFDAALTSAGAGAWARALEALSSAERRLDDAVRRLDTIAVGAVQAAERTRWQTDAATRFFAAADAWRRAVAVLPSEVAAARDETVRARLRIESRVWTGLE